MKNILREIGMIARALDSISNIEFKEHDLTKGQYLYVIRICENPGIIQEQLVNMIKVDRSTATRALQKLETNGFIEKQNDPDNKKNKRLFPTELNPEWWTLDKRPHSGFFVFKDIDILYLFNLDGRTIHEQTHLQSRSNQTT